MNVVPATNPPVPAAAGACPNCGAALSADQRYCLACGRPCSPVRLAFLDVLQSESQAAAGWRAPTNAQALGFASSGSPVLPPGPPMPPVIAAHPAGSEEHGPIAGLRRYSGLMGLLALLLMAGLIGLLVGHWANGGSSGPQVVKIEGLPAAAASGAAAPTTPAAASSSSSNAGKAKASNAPETEAEAQKQVKEAEAKPLPKPVKLKSNATQELNNSTGKAHREKITKILNEHPEAPIETG